MTITIKKLTGRVENVSSNVPEGSLEKKTNNPSEYQQMTRKTNTETQWSKTNQDRTENRTV